MTRVLNVMLGKGSGGLEQMAANYAQAAQMLGHESHVLLARGGDLAKKTSHHTITPHFLRQLFQGDPLASWQTRRRLQRLQPTLIISHGNRALKLVTTANHQKIPHIFVLHNYRTRQLPHLSGVIATTPDLAAFAERHMQGNCPIFTLPNFILPPPAPRARAARPQPVIGFLGRFVPNKGVDILLNALVLLRAQSLQPQVLIAGAGPLQPMIEQVIGQHQLGGQVKLLGWIEDKADFFASIDILAVPSRVEPFGLVFLEAWHYGAPVVTTPNEGAIVLVNPNTNGLRTADFTAAALAENLRLLLCQPALRDNLRDGGLHSVQQHLWPAGGIALEKIIQHFV